MLASRTLGRHLARGALGIGALVTAAVTSTRHPWLALLLLPVAVVALRGCPLCWIVGLVQTVTARLPRAPLEDGCWNGRCDAAPSGQADGTATSDTQQ